MRNWLKRHMQVFFYTLGQFTRNRLNVSMTLLALGIGFSIPVVMYSVVDSVSNIGGLWQERPQITLYLNKSINDTQIESLKLKLSKDPRFGEIQFISADDGLKELAQTTSLIRPLPCSMKTRCPRYSWFSRGQPTA